MKIEEEKPDQSNWKQREKPMEKKILFNWRLTWIQRFFFQTLKCAAKATDSNKSKSFQ